MTILELYQKGFNAAVEELAEQHDDITTYETLKEFIKSKIDADNLNVVAHLTDALNTCEYAEYYRYDYCMGTLETPTPLKDESDLEEFCDGKTFTVDARINSLGGKMDEITVFEERQNGNQKYYIVRYKDVFCTAIFNGFTCTYYADDVYGRIEQRKRKKSPFTTIIPALKKKTKHANSYSRFTPTKKIGNRRKKYPTSVYMTR